jgi:hypothetical protein
VRAGKKAVLINVPKKQASTFKLASDWEHFVRSCPTALISDLRKRATSEEWLLEPKKQLKTRTLKPRSIRSEIMMR